MDSEAIASAFLVHFYSGLVEGGPTAVQQVYGSDSVVSLAPPDQPQRPVAQGPEAIAQGWHQLINDIGGLRHIVVSTVDHVQQTGTQGIVILCNGAISSPSGKDYAFAHSVQVHPTPRRTNTFKVVSECFRVLPCAPLQVTERKAPAASRAAASAAPAAAAAAASSEVAPAAAPTERPARAARAAPAAAPTAPIVASAGAAPQEAAAPSAKPPRERRPKKQDEVNAGAAAPSATATTAVAAAAAPAASSAPAPTSAPVAPRAPLVATSPVVHVENLRDTTKEDDVKAVFATFGTVTSVAWEGATGAIVTFSSIAEAQAAVSVRRAVIVLGKRVRISP